MSEFIKNLGLNAKDYYEENYSEGDLQSPSGPYLVYDITSPESIQLDGELTIEQLESLVSHMKKFEKET